MMQMARIDSLRWSNENDLGNVFSGHGDLFPFVARKKDHLKII
jgi:hypothetical protein